MEKTQKRVENSLFAQEQCETSERLEADLGGLRLDYASLKEKSEASQLLLQQEVVNFALIYCSLI